MRPNTSTAKQKYRRLRIGELIRTGDRIIGKFGFKRFEFSESLPTSVSSSAYTAVTSDNSYWYFRKVMPALRQKSQPAKTAPPSSSSSCRAAVALMYPPTVSKTPLIWELSQKFPVVPNIGYARVTDEISFMRVELTGARQSITDSLDWLKKQNVSVELLAMN